MKVYTVHEILEQTKKKLLKAQEENRSLQIKLDLAQLRIKQLESDRANLHNAIFGVSE